jgi:hypothetical protein
VCSVAGGAPPIIEIATTSPSAVGAPDRVLSAKTAELGVHARRALDAKAPQPIGRHLVTGPAGSKRGSTEAYDVLLFGDLLVTAVVVVIAPVVGAIRHQRTGTEAVHAALSADGFERVAVREQALEQLHARRVIGRRRCCHGVHHMDHVRH